MNYRECMRAASREQQEALRLLDESDLPAASPAPGFSLSSMDEAEEGDLSGNLREYHLRAKIDPRQSFPKFWRTLINLGYAVNLRSQNLDSALNRTSNELNFRYARICRITDLISESRSGGRSFYDFSAVFSIPDSGDNGYFPDSRLTGRFQGLLSAPFRRPSALPESLH